MEASPAGAAPPPERRQRPRRPLGSPAPPPPEGPVPSLEFREASPNCCTCGEQAQAVADLLLERLSEALAAQVAKALAAEGLLERAVQAALGASDPCHGWCLRGSADEPLHDRVFRTDANFQRQVTCSSQKSSCVDRTSERSHFSMDVLQTQLDTQLLQSENVLLTSTSRKPPPLLATSRIVPISADEAVRAESFQPNRAKNDSTSQVSSSSDPTAGSANDIGSVPANTMRSGKSREECHNAGSANDIGSVPANTLRRSFSGKSCKDCRELPVVHRDSRSSNFRGLEGLQKQRVTELTGVILSDTYESEMGLEVLQSRQKADHLSTSLLKLCGILPWDLEKPGDRRWSRFSICYQLAVLAAMPAAALCLCAQRSFAADSLGSDLPLGLGSLAGLVALIAPWGGGDLRNCFLMLRPYIRQDGVRISWSRRMYFDIFTLLVTWSGAIGLSAFNCEQMDATAGLGLLTMALAGGVMLGLSFCLLYVCSALASVIDIFCSDVSRDEEIMAAVRKWNIVQAVLRKGSRAIALCMITLQATVIWKVLWCVIIVMKGGQNALTLAPGGLVVIYVTQTFFRSAAVTDKCVRVPPLINSLGADPAFLLDGMKLERQYVVQYIINSEAGFYVFGVRVSSAIVLRLLYICGAVVFAVVTKVL